MTTTTRRDVIKKVFIAPVILTWPVTPSMARAGSNDVSDGSGEHWTVTVLGAEDNGTTAQTFFGDGTYLLFPEGQTYIHQGNWVFIGWYPMVTLPPDFPMVTLGPTMIAVSPK